MKGSELATFVFKLTAAVDSVGSYHYHKGTKKYKNTKIITSWGSWVVTQVTYIFSIVTISRWINYFYVEEHSLPLNKNGQMGI